MYWVAFKGYYNGKALSLGTVEQLEAEAMGFHGYGTEAEAEANPNTVNFAQKAQVNAWVFNAQGSLTQHLAPHIPVIGPAINAGEKAVGALTDVNTFLSRLTSPNTWIRAGEFILGALLILSGALTLAGKNGDVVTLAKKVVK